MNDRDQRDAATPVAQGPGEPETAADGSSRAQDGDRPDEFSQLEWQRLVFLRWLWRQGRLSEQLAQ